MYFKNLYNKIRNKQDTKLICKLVFYKTAKTIFDRSSLLRIMRYFFHDDDYDLPAHFARNSKFLFNCFLYYSFYTAKNI